MLHGIGNYSCQIFNKKCMKLTKVLDWVTQETKNQLSIVVLNHDRGLYVVCETFQQE